jgi:hypothetical protein
MDLGQLGHMRLARRELRRNPGERLRQLGARLLRRERSDHVSPGSVAKDHISARFVFDAFYRAPRPAGIDGSSPSEGFADLPAAVSVVSSDRPRRVLLPMGASCLDSETLTFRPAVGGFFDYSSGESCVFMDRSVRARAARAPSRARSSILQIAATVAPSGRAAWCVTSTRELSSAQFDAPNCPTLHSRWKENRDVSI